jgi:hypothetical protein
MIRNVNFIYPLLCYWLVDTLEQKDFHLDSYREFNLLRMTFL